MKKPLDLFTALFLLTLTLASLAMSGCAAALIGAGAVGGYAVAKDMEDGELIDTPKAKEENKGWFGGK